MLLIAQLMVQQVYRDFWLPWLAVSAVALLIVVVLLVCIWLELLTQRHQRAQYHELTKNPNGPIR